MSMSDWNIVTRSMRSRLFSSVVTVLSVAIAVGLVTLLVSMRNAGENSFKRGTGNVQMLISKEPGPLPSVLNSMFYAEAPGNPIAMMLPPGAAEKGFTGSFVRFLRSRLPTSRMSSIRAAI